MKRSFGRPHKAIFDYIMAKREGVPKMPSKSGIPSWKRLGAGTSLKNAIKPRKQTLNQP